MKLFKTNNGINMVECKPYNWEVSYKFAKTQNPRLISVTKNGNPLIFTIFIGSMGDSRTISFDPLRKILFVSDIAIKVSTFEEASEIVENIAKTMERRNNSDARDFEEVEENKYKPEEGYSIYLFKPSEENYKNVDPDVKKDFEKLYKKYNENLRKEKLENLDAQ